MNSDFITHRNKNITPYPHPFVLFLRLIVGAATSAIIIFNHCRTRLVDRKRLTRNTGIVL